MEIKKHIKETEKTLTQNIVRSLVQLEFHQKISEDELFWFYGGSVNREALVNDTLRNLQGDQMLLKFIVDNKNQIIKKYGQEDPTGDFTKSYKLPIGVGAKQKGGDKSSGGNESGTDSIHSTRSKQPNGKGGTKSKG